MGRDSREGWRGLAATKMERRGENEPKGHKRGGGTTNKTRERKRVGWLGAGRGETEETRKCHGLICRIEKEGILFKEILQQIQILLETV